MHNLEQEKFYGRKETLEILRRRVIDLKDGYRQNMAFLGDRYTGKTMIVRKFLADIDDPQLVPLYIDLESADLHDFLYKVAGTLLHHFGRTKGFAVSDDLLQLMSMAETRLPETVKVIKKAQNHLSHGREREAYLETISLPQIFSVEADTFCILLLDEFQHLEEFGLKVEFQELGKQIMTQRRCLYVITSSVPWSAHKILSEKLSLLFGNFEVIEVQAFDLKTSKDFIWSHLPGLKMSDGLASFLIDFTGGHPLYLTLICQELRALSAQYKQSEVYLPLLSRAIEETLAQRWGVLNRHFELIVERMTAGKGNAPASRVLLALTRGRKKVSELAVDTKCKQSQLAQQMTRLLEQGVVLKNGNYFYIPDKLFKYWLRFVLYRRRRALCDDREQEQKDFREELSRAFEASRSNAERAFSSQVQDLLSCFDNEALLINGRRYKLPALRDMVPAQIKIADGQTIDLIKASAEDGQWLIILRSGSLGESEINHLLAETRKISQKPQRSVLIALDPLDENARLRALQERMWIWNERELSALATIFDRSILCRHEVKP